MRIVDLGSDLDRLRHAIRDELAVQHGIHRRDIGEQWLDMLTDMLLSRIDYGFDVRWVPKWVRPGEAHRWSENGEHFVECLHCGAATAHSFTAPRLTPPEMPFGRGHADPTVVIRCSCSGARFCVARPPRGLSFAP